MRILALDHGEARVGAAVCDPTETIASPSVVLGPDPAEVGVAARGVHEAQDTHSFT